MRVPLTNLFQVITEVPASPPNFLVRACEIPVGLQPVLDFKLGTNQSGAFLIFGRSGSTYELQRLTDPLAPWNWVPLLNVPLTNGFQAVDGLPLTNSTSFYRLRLR